MMVCLGNICRLPVAEGILQSKVDARGLDWEVAPSGTSGYHVGQLPDARSMEIANRHGLDISDQRSQRFLQKHLVEYDFILAMDIQNFEDILSMCQTKKERDKVQLIMDYGDDLSVKNVPDPYYGNSGDDGFSDVYDMLDEVTEAFMRHLVLAEDEGTRPK